mgnify:CR=1 FL=1
MCRDGGEGLKSKVIQSEIPTGSGHRGLLRAVRGIGTSLKARIGRPVGRDEWVIGLVVWGGAEEGGYDPEAVQRVQQWLADPDAPPVAWVSGEVVPTDLPVDDPRLVVVTGDAEGSQASFEAGLEPWRAAMAGLGKRAQRRARRQVRAEVRQQVAAERKRHAAPPVPTWRPRPLITAGFGVGFFLALFALYISFPDVASDRDADLDPLGLRDLASEASTPSPLAEEPADGGLEEPGRDGGPAGGQPQSPVTVESLEAQLAEASVGLRTDLGLPLDGTDLETGIWSYLDRNLDSLGSNLDRWRVLSMDRTPAEVEAAWRRSAETSHPQWAEDLVWFANESWAPLLDPSDGDLAAAANSYAALCGVLALLQAQAGNTDHAIEIVRGMRWLSLVVRRSSIRSSTIERHLFETVRILLAQEHLSQTQVFWLQLALQPSFDWSTLRRQVRLAWLEAIENSRGGVEMVRRMPSFRREFLAETPPFLRLAAEARVQITLATETQLIERLMRMAEAILEDGVGLTGGYARTIVATLGFQYATSVMLQAEVQRSRTGVYPDRLPQVELPPAMDQVLAHPAVAVTYLGEPKQFAIGISLHGDGFRSLTTEVPQALGHPLPRVDLMETE